MIFNDPKFAAMFEPKFGGMMIKLSEEATRAIASNYRGRKSKELQLYVMITFEGDLDPNWPFEHVWGKVERRVKEESLVYYSAKKKTCVRPVWHQPVGARTMENNSWERVRLIPVEREIIKANLPSNARLFDQ